MQANDRNELKLGVLYKVESPIIFYHIHHYGTEGECYMQKQINTTLYSRNHITNDGYKLKQEELFESVRKENTPSFPSRRNCLFLSKTKEDARYWHNYFRKRCNYTKCYKVTLLSGKYVLLDSELYDEGKPLEYWKGEQISGYSDYIEILFEGKCRTEEIVTNWD